MRLLLDTVAFIWAVTSADRISNKAMAALRSEATIREISVVSLSEVAIKQSIGKLKIGKDEVLTGIADLRLRVLPYTACQRSSESVFFRTLAGWVFCPLIFFPAKGCILWRRYSM